MPSDFNKELIQIINKSPVIVFLLKNSKGWPVEFVSENIKEYGYEPNEFLSGKILYADFIYPDDRTRIENEVKAYSDSNISEFTQEYRILTKNKEIYWVDDRTFIRRDKKGRITHYQGIILDITERKELEQKISESENLFRKILENTFIGFAIHQRSKMLYVNKALSAIAGYSIEELLNWKIPEFIEKIHPDYREIVISRLQIHQKGDENIYTFTEFPIYTKSGELKWVYTNEKSILYHNKPAIITALVDITEMKRIERKLYESQQNYQKAYERENFYKDLFTHDMRNIIHGILNILEFYHLKE
ncbi:MAG: PAS domain S-box protein, partial [Candidatus Odinarchaeota archaeon]